MFADVRQTYVATKLSALRVRHGEFEMAEEGCVEVAGLCAHHGGAAIDHRELCSGDRLVLFVKWYKFAGMLLSRRTAIDLCFGRKGRASLIGTGGTSRHLAMGQEKTSLLEPPLATGL